MNHDMTQESNSQGKPTMSGQAWKAWFKWKLVVPLTVIFL